jgi:hypothetical protein
LHLLIKHSTYLYYRLEGLHPEHTVAGGLLMITELLVVEQSQLVGTREPVAMQPSPIVLGGVARQI